MRLKALALVISAALPTAAMASALPTNPEQHQKQAYERFLKQKAELEQQTAVVRMGEQSTRPMPSVTPTKTVEQRIFELRAQHPHLQLPEFTSAIQLEQYLKKLASEAAAKPLVKASTTTQPVSLLSSQTNLTSVTTLASSTNAEPAWVSKLVSSHFLYSKFSDNEIYNRGRLQLNADGTGTIRLSNTQTSPEPRIINWRVENQQLILEYPEPVFENESFLWGDNYGLPSQVRRQTFIERYVLNVTEIGDGYLDLVGTYSGYYTFPDNDIADEAYEFGYFFTMAEQAKAVDIATLLPAVGERVSVPWIERWTKFHTVQNRTSGLTISNSTIELVFTEIEANTAAGVWQRYDYEQEQIIPIEEPFTAVFQADGSAVLTGVSGDTMQLSAYRSADSTVNLMTVASSVKTGTTTLSQNPHSFKHNPDFNFELPQVLRLVGAGYNDTYQAWFEFDEQGTGTYFIASDHNGDGKYSPSEISRAPFNWQYDSTANKLTLARYRDISSNQACLNQHFAPSPEDSCRLITEQFFEFKNATTADVTATIDVKYQDVFYQNFINNDGAYFSFPYMLQTYNRKILPAETRPIIIPEVPANDAYENAIMLTGTGGFEVGTTENATMNYTDACWYQCPSSSVWYKFEPTATGVIQISIAPEDFEATAVLLQGVPGANWSGVGGQGSANGKLYLEWTIADLTNPIYFMVGGVNNSTGSFSFNWQFVADTATPISGLVFEDENLQNCVLNTGAVYVEQVEYLHCNNVTSLAGMESLTHLRNLGLYAQSWSSEDPKLALTDLSPLAGLSRLWDLSIYNYAMDDAAFNTLQGLAQSPFRRLQNLQVYNTEITDASMPLVFSLIANSDYSSLYLVRNQIAGEFSAEQIGSVNSISLAENPITDIVATFNKFKDIHSLYSFDLTGFKNIDYSKLQLAVNLRHLRLGQENKPDLQFLKLIPGVEQLTGFEFSNGVVDSLAGLETLKNLESLYLFSVEVTDTSSFNVLKQLTALNTFFMDNTNLRDLSVFKGISLFSLQFSSSQVYDLSPLYEQTNLAYLYLYNNPQLLCSDIEALQAKLPNLYISKPDLCAISPGVVDLTSRFGAISTDIFTYFDQAHAALGTLTLKNGILTFTPAKGVTGFISFPINVVVNGVAYWHDVRVYIPTTKPKTKRFPIWFMLPEVLEPQPAK